MKRLVLMGMVAAALAVAPGAEAATITGGISFAGFANPTGGTNWSNATGVSFVNPALAGSGTGSYSGVSGAVTFTNFNYNPFSGAVTPLWTFTSGLNTYSFDLTSISSFVPSGNATLNSVTVTGLGFLNITGFTPTPGVFIFTGNGSQYGTSPATFSFSASNSAVPEPGTLMLLGTGLLGIAAAARRRMRKA